MDNWKNRQNMMVCATCIYCVPKAPAGGSPAVLGRCRRHCPTMNGYPVVMVNDFCGDHRLDENKVSVQPPAMKNPEGAAPKKPEGDTDRPTAGTPKKPGPEEL